MLDLRQFRTLRAIASEGSLAAASRSLHYGQATITHHLATLESHMGCALVDRGPRGTRLTDPGRLLLRHVDLVLTLIDLAEQDVRRHGSRPRPTLRVGTFPTGGARLLPGALKQLDADHGSIELVEAEPWELLDQLRAGAIHCALVYSLDSDEVGATTHDLCVRHIMEDPHRLVLPRGHRLAAEPLVDLSDLKDEGWIFARSPLDPCDRALVAACAPLGFRPRTFLNTDDYALAHAFVAVGACISLIPELGLDRRSAVVVKRTVQDVGSRSVQFVHLAAYEPPELVPRLRAALMAQSRRIVRAGR